MEKYRLIQEQKLEENATTLTTPQSPTLHLDRAASHAGTSSVTPSSRPHATSDTATTTSSNTASSSEYPEVRITQQGKPRNYISYAMNILTDGSSSNYSKTIVLKAMGRAINKAVTIAEILKRKMPLHQWNVLTSLEMIDLYEPIEEGLDVVENRRYVSCLTITLSLTLLPPPPQQQQQQQHHSSSSSATKMMMDDMPPLDIHHFGYQPPLPMTELQQPSTNVATYSHYNKPQQRHRQQE